jgi:hypothetical protein
MKELEFEIEEHRWNRFILTITDEEKFKEELLAWLGKHDSLQFSDLFDNFNYLEVSECDDVNEEANEKFRAEQIKNELYTLFSNEMGIDVELLAFQAKNTRMGKQGEDEGIENDLD